MATVRRSSWRVRWYLRVTIGDPKYTGISFHPHPSRKLDAFGQTKKDCPEPTSLGAQAASIFVSAIQSSVVFNVTSRWLRLFGRPANAPMLSSQADAADLAGILKGLIDMHLVGEHTTSSEFTWCQVMGLRASTCCLLLTARAPNPNSLHSRSSKHTTSASLRRPK